MKCLILAAGYATRLYPLTENFPKPLLEVGGKPILDWLIDDIEQSQLVDEYIVISNHKFATIFQQWAAQRPQPITVLDDGTTSNDTRLGAVRDIQFAIDERQLDDDLLVIAATTCSRSVWSTSCAMPAGKPPPASCATMRRPNSGSASAVLPR